MILCIVSVVFFMQSMLYIMRASERDAIRSGFREMIPQQHLACLHEAHILRILDRKFTHSQRPPLFRMEHQRRVLDKCSLISGGSFQFNYLTIPHYLFGGL